MPEGVVDAAAGLAVGVVVHDAVVVLVPVVKVVSVVSSTGDEGVN